MAGQTYIGNSSGKAVVPRKIYGGVDNVAREVKAVYVGDSNNKAKLVWRSSVVPNGYTQLEYIDFGYPVEIRDYIGYDLFPRIVIDFSMTDISINLTDNSDRYVMYGTNHYNYALSGVMFVNLEGEKNSGDPEHGYRYAAQFGAVDNYSVRELFYAHVSVYNIDEDDDIFLKTKVSDSTEGILLNTGYTLDFFTGTNIKLFNSEGYYSISSHNTLISDAKPTISGYKLYFGYILHYCGWHGKVYSAKVYSGSTLKMDLIPSKRKSDNSYGYYDLVNRIFFKTIDSNNNYGKNIGPEL